MGLDEVFCDVALVGVSARVLSHAFVGHKASDYCIIVLFKHVLDWPPMPQNLDQLGALSVGAGEVKVDPVGKHVLEFPWLARFEERG